ncbi:hypothetical protein MP638_002333 [Amoeboaphelidium occidentale]|nr:hypothetical protein MP638_002333 [Amoeboaphelidium occidentale]
MKFNIYLPPSYESAQGKLAAVYFLSGLTCTEDNFVQKAGALQHFADKNLILIAPDTSPRNCGIEGENESWDFGTGAGFYVDATEKPWSAHYKMYSYITKELYGLIANNFKVDTAKVGIFGHSMGGHGALTIYFKNSDKFKSVSAFAPICNPLNCPWGVKAFTGYLGNQNKEKWEDYDATKLLLKYDKNAEILIDQGAADNFLTGEVNQLLPAAFTRAASAKSNVKLTYREHEGYDHSYYFISTFIGTHVQWHAEKLSK